MKIVEETPSSLEELLKNEGFELIGFSEGKVYEKNYNGSSLTVVLPLLAEGIKIENLTIKLRYVVNGLDVIPEDVEMYRSLGLKSEIPYKNSALKKILDSYEKVL